MERKELKLIFRGILTSEGFVEKAWAWAWYRNVGAVLQIVDVQKSNYGMQFYINIACVPDGMKVEGLPVPKEHKCPIRIRLGSAIPERKIEIDSMLDLETAVPDEQRKNGVAHIVKDVILPYLKSIEDIASIRNEIINGSLRRGFITMEAKRFINAPI